MDDFGAQNISNPSATQHYSSQPYQLTVKRGFLALLVMYACQFLVGVALSYGFRFAGAGGDAGDPIDLSLIGVASVLFGGAFVLLWAWTDVRRFGSPFKPQIGLRKSSVEPGRAAILVIGLLIATHFLAWVYRSVLLPLIDQGGVIGGGSQMFAQMQESGSVVGMTGFLFLALIVGPVMEEVVFRGYLQSSLSRKMPTWGAISITSLVFMAGHSPTILWPMYFVYSVAWGWVFARTKSLKYPIAIHILSNLFYTVIAVMGWEILA